MKHLILIGLLFSTISNAQEDFTDVSNLTGWEFNNQSSPQGAYSWFQGQITEFDAQSGSPTAYIAANYQNTGNNGTICNYLILPEVDMTQINFWTRTRPADDTNTVFPDRLRVLYSPSGDKTPGDCIQGFGDFSQELAVINPDLTTNGYPLKAWEEFTVNIPGPGRVAFVYHVTDAGAMGINSNYIGIDTVSWTEWDDEIFANGFEQ